MRRTLLLLGAAALLLAVPAWSGKDSKRDALTLSANRATWMMGMYVGEDNTKPYPFVIRVDPKADAHIKGIRPGDEIIRFEGEPTSPLKELYIRVQRVRGNQQTVIWVRRGAETIRFFVRAPRNPTAPPVEKAEDDPKPAEDPDKSKKKKKKPPVVIKPIPPPDPDR